MWLFHDSLRFSCRFVIYLLRIVYFNFCCVMKIICALTELYNWYFLFAEVLLFYIVFRFTCMLLLFAPFLHRNVLVYLCTALFTKQWLYTTIFTVRNYALQRPCLRVHDEHNSYSTDWKRHVHVGRRPWIYQTQNQSNYQGGRKRNMIPKCSPRIITPPLLGLAKGGSSVNVSKPIQLFEV